MTAARPARTPRTFEGSEHKNGSFSLAVPDELVEAVAQRVADLLVERHAPEPEPWIGVEQACEHLACPRSRIYALASAGRIPHRKDSARLLFRRAELDDWLEQGGAKRP